MADIVAGRLDKKTIKDNFARIKPPLAENEARVAAERCLFCYDAPCVKACPTGIDIPLFIRQIAAHNPIGAAKTILDSNIMGAVCARVCPTENLCEGVCVRNDAEGKPVEIGQLQRYATDAAFKAGRQFYAAGPASGYKVAVVGAGPAGLACAHKLATFGHRVTVFEAKMKSGGLNEYGVAAYKTLNGIAEAEVNYILAVGGITVEHGKKLGTHFALDDLRKSFDAVFLGMGLADTNDLGLPGRLDGVEDAVTAIAALRQAKDLTKIPVGRRIVVIGGGMTAIDIATQMKLLGAEEVTIVYRRGAADMSASLHEQDLARTHGVVIRHWLRPKRLIGKKGKLAAVELAYTKMKNGKLVDTKETVILPCDQLFRAIGQKLVETDLGKGRAKLKLVNGRIKVDRERRTSLKGVWAGGDCAYGGEDLTVVAVEDGKQAALSIHRYLSAQKSG